MMLQTTKWCHQVGTLHDISLRSQLLGNAHAVVKDTSVFSCFIIFMKMSKNHSNIQCVQIEKISVYKFSNKTDKCGQGLTPNK